MVGHESLALSPRYRLWEKHQGDQYRKIVQRAASSSLLGEEPRKQLLHSQHNRLLVHQVRNEISAVLALDCRNRQMVHKKLITGGRMPLTWGVLFAAMMPRWPPQPARPPCVYVVSEPMGVFRSHFWAAILNTLTIPKAQT